MGRSDSKVENGPQVVYFERPEDFRAWLAANHAESTELWVGFYKKGTNRPSITWPESVDEALCYGWIDGIRKRVDDERYTIRFTPRKARSTWSTVNVGRIAALTREGRMTAAGEAAFAARSDKRTGTYSHEQTGNALVPALEKRLAANPAALTFWNSQAASYRKAATWWVASAKRAETQERRLDQLISYSEAGQTIPQFTRRKPN